MGELLIAANGELLVAAAQGEQPKANTWVGGWTWSQPSPDMYVCVGGGGGEGYVVFLLQVTYVRSPS